MTWLACTSAPSTSTPASAPPAAPAGTRTGGAATTGDGLSGPRCSCPARRSADLAGDLPPGPLGELVDDRPHLGEDPLDFFFGGPPGPDSIRHQGAPFPVEMYRHESETT